MRKALFLMIVVVLIVAIAAPVMAGSHQRNKRNDQGRHDQYDRSPKIHFDWRIFIPPPPVIIIKPFPDPWPDPRPDPPYPYPPHRGSYDGHWETRWEWDSYSQRWYQTKVWVDHYPYRRW